MNGPRRPPLDGASLLEDPIAQFDEWFREAREESGLQLPEAACLSTVDPDGYPEGRMVLLKGFDVRGFVFYTNLNSRKAESLRHAPRAALTFYWEPLRRQVRIQGDVEEVEEEDADAYFASRPRGRQLGAWASDQSAPVPDRETLEDRFQEAEDRFQGGEIPRPAHWGGLRIRPRVIEFWQEGPARLHDRFRYERDDGGWSRTRLCP